MEHTEQMRAPMHLWLVGGLAALWNAFGAYDYWMTRMRDTDYLAAMMPTVDPGVMLDWIDSMPIWVDFGWGLGVWMGLLGAVLLLVRRSWAVWALGLSLVGAVLSLGYQALAAPPLPGADDMMWQVMPYVIIAVAVGLFLYARAMAGKGVLR